MVFGGRGTPQWLKHLPHERLWDDQDEQVDYQIRSRGAVVHWQWVKAPRVSITTKNIPGCSNRNAVEKLAKEACDTPHNDQDDQRYRDDGECLPSENAPVEVDDGELGKRQTDKG